MKAVVEPEQTKASKPEVVVEPEQAVADEAKPAEVQEAAPTVPATE